MTRWSAVEDAAIALLGLGALLVTVYGMACRYLVPAAAPDWGEEVTTYAMVWAMFLGSGALVTHDRHVRADALLTNVSARWRGRLVLGGLVAGLGFSVLMAWYGLQVVGFALRLDERSQSTLRLPLAVYYAGLPAGLGLMALRYGHRLVTTALRTGR